MVRSGILMVCVALSAVMVSGCNRVQVPDVHNQTLVQATATLTNATLAVGTVADDYSVTVSPGSVMEQSPNAGASVAAGTAVNLVLSLGPEPTLAWSYVPDSDSIFGLTIANTADHGFIVGGGHDNTYNMYALKLTSAGAKEWDHTYSNISTSGTPTELWRHEAHGILQTSEGGYIMLGRGSIEDDNLGPDSYVLVKLDSFGNKTWAKTYGTLNPYSSGRLCSSNEPAALDIAGDGGFVVLGQSYVGGYDLASIVKTNASGEVDADGFDKVINDNAKAYEENITDGLHTSDGGYALCGYSANGAPHGYMALLIKVGGDGVLDFAKTYQDVTRGYGAMAHGLAQTYAGGYLLCGELVNSISKSSSHGGWLGKTDENGNLLWMKTEADNPDMNLLYCVKETPRHEILAGSSSNDGHMMLSKFDSDGVLLWNFPFNTLPSAWVKGLALTEDGGVAMVASSVSGGTVIAKVNYAFLP